jgi:hypothetical protein
MDDRIILKWILKKFDGRTWAGLAWVTIGTRGRADVNAVINLHVP